jgi:hypothetical protein
MSFTYPEAKLARTAEGLLALGSAARMRLEITITPGAAPPRSHAHVESSLTS